ncbi:pyridoxamine 5'-phosphate oxidase family protein [Phytoactinopolyspora mesophila]|uniref:DUF385 domain-containing protein n=1 Tax=Phytoactinopolyspora mesophila TaxID=2650750 RepID=A0A7K3MB24_9ACTN|nr:pyridoxamine 5'-phosphate oxidase family protein [Phytoactinopolyspora mesophila]NDL60494.1 DUF385 domain-containing protein [Phytoactinopolyspora mesophila]
MNQSTNLPNLEDKTGASAEQRLQDEKTIRLTTVSAGGQPQSSPVGFLWDGARFLIRSKPGDPKVQNIRHNPRVALHLDIKNDAEDGGVLTFEGTAVIDSGPDDDGETTAYVERYADEIRDYGVPPEDVLSTFSAVIRVTPTRTRAY